MCPKVIDGFRCENRCLNRNFHLSRIGFRCRRRGRQRCGSQSRSVALALVAGHVGAVRLQCDDRRPASPPSPTTCYSDLPHLDRRAAACRDQRDHRADADARRSTLASDQGHDHQPPTSARCSSPTSLTHRRPTWSASKVRAFKQTMGQLEHERGGDSTDLVSQPRPVPACPWSAPTRPTPLVRRQVGRISEIGYQDRAHPRRPGGV